MKVLAACLVFTACGGSPYTLGIPLVPEMLCIDSHTMAARSADNEMLSYTCAGGCSAQYGVVRCDVTEELAGSACAWVFEGKQACSRPSATLVCDRELWRYVSFEPCTLATYVEAD